MNKTHYIFIVFIFQFLNQTYCQNQLGIWYSGYEREEQTYKSNSNTIDTFYYDTHSLIDFVDDENIILKGIGGKELKGKYKVKRNKLRIVIEDHKVKGKITNDEIVIYNQSLRDREIIFQRLSQNNLSDSCKIDSISLINKNWITTTDSSSCYFGWDYHFLDSGIVVISKDFGDFGYTNWGEYRIDWYKNHLFLAVRDVEDSESVVYHISDKDEYSFTAHSYELCGLPGSIPNLKALQIKNSNLMNNNQLSNIRLMLIGKWTASNSPFCTDFFNKKTQKYNIEFFESNEYKIEKSAILELENRDVNIQDTVIGKWELSETGKYITLTPNDSRSRHLTIHKLQTNSMTIYSDEKLSNAGVYITEIKLTK